jgi:hypothetical protein
VCVLHEDSGRRGSDVEMSQFDMASINYALAPDDGVFNGEAIANALCVAIEGFRRIRRVNHPMIDIYSEC